MMCYVLLNDSSVAYSKSTSMLSATPFSSLMSFCTDLDVWRRNRDNPLLQSRSYFPWPKPLQVPQR